jgi:hypothetical protein
VSATPAYPKTICGVVYQNEDWRNRCQFSFACDNIKDRVEFASHYKNRPRSRDGGDRWQDLHPGGRLATHYHAVYVNPKWARHEKGRPRSVCTSSTAPMAAAGAERPGRARGVGQWPDCVGIRRVIAGRSRGQDVALRQPTDFLI